VKSFLKILVALMLGMLVVFSTVSCSDSNDAGQKEEEKDDEKDNNDKSEEKEKSETVSNVSEDEEINDGGSESNDDNGKEDTKSEDEVEAEKVLKDALDCLEDCDFDGLAEFMVDPGDYEDCGISSADDFVDELVEYYGLEFVLWYEFGYNADDVQEAVTDFCEDVLNSIDYEIEECTHASNNKVVFDVRIDYPDITSISLDKLDDRSEAFEVLEEAYGNGVLDGSMTEDEAVETLLDFSVDVIDNAMDNLEKTSEYKSITVIKKNGEWLVDDDFENPIFKYLY